MGYAPTEKCIIRIIKMMRSRSLAAVSSRSHTPFMFQGWTLVLFQVLIMPAPRPDGGLPARCSCVRKERQRRLHDPSRSSSSPTWVASSASVG